MTILLVIFMFSREQNNFTSKEFVNTEYFFRSLNVSGVNTNFKYYVVYLIAFICLIISVILVSYKQKHKYILLEIDCNDKCDEFLKDKEDIEDFITNIRTVIANNSGIDKNLLNIILMIVLITK